MKSRYDTADRDEMLQRQGTMETETPESLIEQRVAL